MGTPNHNDDWNDLKTKGASSNAVKSATTITAGTGQIFKDWVGYNDEWDYRAITLASAAKLSLSISANNNAAKFGLYQLVETTDKKGNKTYSLKKLLTVTPKRDKNGNYTVTTDGKLLEKGTYYIGVQAANAKKTNASTDYTVSLNKNGSIFYNNSKSLNTDDWNDLKDKGASSDAVKTAITITASTGQFISDWVGFGDAVDYKGFTIGSAAKLSFTVSAKDAVKVTLCELQTSSKKGKNTYSLKNLLTVTPKRDKNGNYTISTDGKLLEKGTYYLCVQSTNAAKGGNAAYTISLNKSGSEFFTRGSSDDNNWDAAPALIGKLTGDYIMDLTGSFSGWVGYGDAVDYRTFTTNAKNGNGGYYTFALELTEGSKNSLNLSLYEIVDKKGVKSLKKMKGATATTKRNGVILYTMLKPNTNYVVGVEAPGAKQAKGSSYKMSVEQEKAAHFDMTNNDKEHATKITPSSDDIFGTVTKAAGGDWVDWYDISAFAGTYSNIYLTDAFEKCSVKLTFYNRDMTESKVWVQTLDRKGKWSNVSSIISNNKYGFNCDFAAASDYLQYLKVEATNSGRNSYCLAAMW